MNNDQFRRLVLDTPTTPTTNNNNARNTTKNPGATPSAAAAAALGSRLRSSIPMTPRALNTTKSSLHHEFARQLADHRREQLGGVGGPPAKRFKASAAPKGTKLPEGYRDRAALLRGVEQDLGADGDGDGGGGKAGAEGEELEKRVKALEEMVKLGQIDQGTFEGLIREMGVGGDLGSTHMVKGLDWELLRRVRQGEDVSGTVTRRGEGEGEGVEGVEGDQRVGDVDDELDQVLGVEEGLPSAPKEQKVKKKGVMAPPPPSSRLEQVDLGVPRSRDEILRQLKASRAAAAAAAAAAAEAEEQQPVEPALGERFKRIGGESKVEKKRWIEQDETGRRKEILQITDAQGKVKRKVRWLDKPGEAPAPAPAAKPLGMEVPAELAAKAAPAPAEEEDDDIFAGVGADYNPLADLGDEDDSSSSDESDDGEVTQKKAAQTTDTAPAEATADMEKTPVEDSTGRPRNYFATSTTEEVPEIDRSNPLAKDATLLAALKRAAALRQSEETAGEGEEDVDAETALRRKRFLEEARRREALDAMDMDMGFGGSRVGDEEDDEEVVLEGEGRGGKKRKRGPKKKKGDKNSASDVLRVMEGRKQGQ